MSTWSKEDVPLIALRNWTTGAEDTASYTVKLQPKNQDYDTGAIACSQCTTEQWLWRPDADLDSETDYWIYVNATKKGSLNANDGITLIPGGD